MRVPSPLHSLSTGAWSTSREVCCSGAASPERAEHGEGRSTNWRGVVALEQWVALYWPKPVGHLGQQRELKARRPAPQGA
jgi:hypothetical protein